MRRATHTVVLISVLLLACSHERVDLGGSGAGGSRLLPTAAIGGGSPTAASRLPTPTSTTPGQSNAPTDTLTARQAPFVALPTVATPPSPLYGLSSQVELLPPISGGTLAVAADGSVAVAADPDRDLVYLIDLATDGVQALMLPSKSEPGRVVLDDRGRAHVVLRSAGQLARIELATASVAVSEPICQHPRGLAYNAPTRSVHVACADGQLIELSADTHSMISRERLAPDLRDIVIGPNDTRIVSRFRNSALLWRSLAHSADTVEVELPELPWPALLPTAATGSTTGPTRPTFAFRTLSAADGTLWVLHQRAQQDPLPGDDYSGKDSGCGPVVQPALTHFGASGQAEVLDSLQLNGSAAPAVDLAVSHDGRWVAVATPSAYAQRRASAQLYPIEALAAQGDPAANMEFPQSPSDLCTRPVFIGLASDTQAVAVAFDQQNLLYIQNRFPARLDIVRVTSQAAPVTRDERNIHLNDPAARDLGHEWFHAELGQSRVSCAACHAEGLDDGHTWRFSQGPRRTPSLRGGLSQTAPFTWEGTQSTLDTAITLQIETRLNVHDVPTAAVSAIGSWLDKLPTLSMQQDPAAADSGKALFESAELGCATCHSGPRLTNNQTVDVSSGGQFQVPSLLGLALRGPYMHDGCAADLTELFSTPDCARAGHAGLAALSGAEARDLQAYLLSL